MAERALARRRGAVDIGFIVYEADGTQQIGELLLKFVIGVQGGVEVAAFRKERRGQCQGDVHEWSFRP